MRIKSLLVFAATLAVGVTSAGVVLPFGTQVSVRPAFAAPAPMVSTAVAFDISPAVRNLVAIPRLSALSSAIEQEVRPEPGPIVNDAGFTGDAAVQQSQPLLLTLPNAPAIPNPSLTFEGLSSQDNFDIFGFRVTPPDPSGAVGPDHYVEIVNLVFAVYSKTGTRLAGPIDTGSLWAGFAVPDCTDPSGDPIVVYDRHEDRWLLTQFTTRGMNPDGSFNGKPFYNCVAISQTEDPTGAYFRYAFVTSAPGSVTFFPDYPKYGVWRDSYLLTSRDFGPTVEYGISVYALEKQKMIEGDANARMVHFFLDSAVVPIAQIGDGLLPADIDGKKQPPAGAPAPIVGTMDDEGRYHAPFDALNIYELAVDWENLQAASLNLVAQLPVAEFNSTFPCTDTITQPPASQTRSCIPQPGTTRKIDILSYRQRPTWRLAYRNFGAYETMVTNQSVQARKGIAGVRWYEIQRTHGQFSLFQQGTFAPDDGIHRWMASVAMDKRGNIALGYSVSNSTDVFPGIRYTGRLSGDPLGQMTLGEGVIINGSGSQLSRFSRWGDYTSMNVDPDDDCTFWYVNEYYATTSVNGWKTRVGNFGLPGCKGEDDR